MRDEIEPELHRHASRRWYRLGYQAVILIAVLWTLQFSVTTIRQNFFSGSEAPGLDALSRRLLVCFGGGILFYALGIVLEQLRERSFAFRAALAFPLAWIGAILHAVVNALVFYVIYPLNPRPPISEAWEPSGLFINVHYWMWGFLAWATIYLALSYSREVAERDQRLREFQVLTHKAQLRALRYQINPHFLFNALNAVSSLVTGGSRDRAEAVLANLSDFLRASLATDPLEDIPLWREIEYERLYLDIEMVRFPDRLRVEIDLPDAVRSALVPSLILQPLIENAIKHSVAAAVDIVTLRLSVRAEADRLIVNVTDDGPGSAAPDHRKSSGVGLENVRQRLFTKFPEAAEFAAGPRSPKGFAVRFSVPLRLQ